MAVIVRLPAVLSGGFVAAAAEAGPSAATWVPPDAAAWQDLTPTIAALADDPTDIALCTVAVDRTNGWLYAQPQNCGLWRSKDQGRTFQQIGRDVINKGTRPLPQLGLRPSPSRGRQDRRVQHVLLLEGSHGTLRLLAGRRRYLEGVRQVRTPADRRGHELGRRLQHRALQWMAGPPRAVLQLRRRQALDPPRLEQDGQSSQRFGFFYQGYGIFSPSVLVTSTGEVTLRSEDAGKTWTEIGKHGASGPVWFFKGKPYWMSTSGVLTTDDAGKTWTLVGSKLPAWGVAGPYFGKDERHIVVATATGFYESTDGCNAWHKLCALSSRVRRSRLPVEFLRLRSGPRRSLCPRRPDADEIQVWGKRGHGETGTQAVDGRHGAGPADKTRCRAEDRSREALPLRGLVHQSSDGLRRRRPGHDPQDGRRGRILDRAANGRRTRSPVRAPFPHGGQRLRRRLPGDRFRHQRRRRHLDAEAGRDEGQNAVRGPFRGCPHRLRRKRGHHGLQDHRRRQELGAEEMARARSL